MWRKNECYAEPIGYSPNEFVRILVIEGCFIIELFRKIAYKELREKNDLIFTGDWMFLFLLHDLILLENQVPWIVMDRLFNMTMDPTHNKPLIELVKTFLHTFLFTESLMATLLSQIGSISSIFEQCCLDCEPRFTSYAILLDNLINTTKDMDILCENKVIDNWLNPDDAVPFFNKLYYNTHLKKEIYY
ncbi:hypothetical protein SO802_001602 [Lithocarpus litseifolius]|uniref:Uncharacterized protein n=1 Tax=Lithocarpus litseifolius TaxID=425828 RepID=A0AAW2DYF5_9ROSI